MNRTRSAILEFQIDGSDDNSQEESLTVSAAAGISANGDTKDRVFSL